MLLLLFTNVILHNVFTGAIEALFYSKVFTLLNVRNKPAVLCGVSPHPGLDYGRFIQIKWPSKIKCFLTKVIMVHRRAVGLLPTGH